MSSTVTSAPADVKSNAPDSYDIVIAGGGATACIVAARVAEADRSLKILILEVSSLLVNLECCVLTGVE